MATVFILLACTVIHLATASVVNVAQGKPASMSSSRSGYSASEAVDGDTNAGTWGGSTIINTNIGETFAWWKVDLQREVQNATVRIYFRADYKKRRNGVKLYTSTSPFPELNPTSRGELCHTVTGDPSGSDIPDVYSVTCPGRWRYLLLYTDTDNDGQGPVLDFGEVQVLGITFWSNYYNLEHYRPDCSLCCSARNCFNDSSPCDHVTGQCVGGCKPGYIGIDCTEIQPCADNYYGPECTNLCSERKCNSLSSSSCDQEGRCESGCQAGWMNIDCSQTCTSGSYGPGCSLSCSTRECSDDSSPCDHVTGQCDGGCKPGYRDTDCRQQCQQDFYGPGCTSSCSGRKCKPSSSQCDHVTGQCLYGCQDGYRGLDCTQQCETGSYGPGCSLSCSARNCSDGSSSCDHVTGQCVGGCKSGYKGTDCIQKCITGNYGLNCSKSCINRHCVTSSDECDHQSGQCPDGCKLGWRGLDCTSQCPVGTFGSDCTSCSTRHCQGELDCPADGSCSQGCQDGWTENTCKQECSKGFYGPGCNKACGNCSSGPVCDHVTGNCVGGCKAGWRTSKCDQVCLDGTYGPDCTEKCGECDGVCDSVDGRCPAGCLEGFNGTWCNVSLAEGNINGKEPVRFGVTSLVGAVVGTFLVVVLLCVGIIICLIRQGRLQWIKRLEDRKPAQASRDHTQMSNMTPRPADVSEHAQSSHYVYNNDYAVLDSDTIRGNKDYDVIQPKHYQNL